MKQLAILLLAICGANVYADEIVLHTISRHTDWNHDKTVTVYDTPYTYHTQTYLAYNNVNYGLGYRTDNGWMVGVYKNSYYRPSVYAGKQFMYNEYVGAYLGLATGYDIAVHYPVMPIGGLLLRVPVTETIKLNFSATPPIGRASGVLHLAISYAI